MSFTPTLQQRDVIDLALQRQSMVVQARAGTGKTTTMAQLSWEIHRASRGGARIGYIAYNKSVQLGAQDKMSPSTDCRTAHSLAFEAVGRQYAHRLGVQGDVKPWFIPNWLGYKKGFQISGFNKAGMPIRVKGGSLTRLAKDTVKSFQDSADSEINWWHCRLPREIDGEVALAVRETVVESARKMWLDIVDPACSEMTFTHDAYLKIFGLRFVEYGWRLPYDVLIGDEFQDANPIISQIFLAQPGTQKIATGDSAQSIYSWRGATDTLGTLSSSGANTLYLTQSFRFGPEIAAAGNTWLTLAGFDNPVVGDPSQPGKVGEVDQDQPHAVLCRTNTGCVDAAITAIVGGRTVHLVGGTGQCLELVKEIDKLHHCKESTHPALIAFPNRARLDEHIASGMCDNNELVLANNLLAKYGIERIERVLVSCSTPRYDAHVVVSTAHKFKGDEHDQVIVGSDFVAPVPTVSNPTGRPTREQCMLNYVVTTRARKVLDSTALAWGADYC